MAALPVASLLDENTFRRRHMHPLLTTIVADQIIEERVAQASRARRFTLRRLRWSGRRASSPVRPLGRAAPRSM
jgi:hypothetical protein